MPHAGAFFLLPKSDATFLISLRYRIAHKKAPGDTRG